MTSERPAVDPRFVALLLGGATVVAQALLLREAMAAMGGSEMAWGLVMALWLTGVAGGARLGVRHGSADLAALMPVVILVLAGTGIVLLRAAPAIIGVAPGETVTTYSAVWLWFLAVVPAAVAGGLAFPALANALGPTGGGRAYAFEGLGALAGGFVLTIGLLHLGAAAALCLGLGTVAATSAWLRRSAVLAILAASSLAAAIPAGGFLARASWAWSGHPGSLQTWIETRHQQVLVSDGPPTSVYGDGRLVASYPDPYTVQPRAHLLTLLHPNPRRILAIDCVADGSVEALSRHHVDRLAVIEEDPDLLRALPGIYGTEMGAALDRPAVEAVAADPLQALEVDDNWDLIILLGRDPATLRGNRTRTLEFLRRCRAHMRPDGVLVMRVGVSDTYIGGTGGRLLSVLASTVQEVFEQLVIIPGEESLLVAGGPRAEITLDHETLTRRLDHSALDDDEFMPEMVPLLVDRDRSIELASRLPLDSEFNTIRHPRAVLLAGSLHEARVFPGLLPTVASLERSSLKLLSASLVVAVLTLLGVTAFSKLTAGATAATVGFCSMGWWLLLIATWQSTNGSVYSEIGALTALFMAGLTVGALAASWMQRPERSVPIVFGVGSTLSVALATGLAFAAPTVTIPILLAAAGLLTGAAFPGLTRLGSRDTRRSAGIAFAADEAGAAAAAIAVAVFAVPLVGITVTAWGLAALQLAAIPLVIVTLRRLS